MARKYHTLLRCYTETFTGESREVWHTEFGSYDKSEVKDELDAHKAGCGVKAKRLKIITTGDAQADIDAAVAKLNGSR